MGQTVPGMSQVNFPGGQTVWPIIQNHVYNKQYIGKADFLVFQAMNQHDLLGQL